MIRGHEVIIAPHPNFFERIRNLGNGYFDLGIDPLEATLQRSI